MVSEPATLGAVCSAHLLKTKWLIAPSYRVGNQWVESVVRDGQSVVNLRSTTTHRLALDLVGSELAASELTMAGVDVGLLVMDAAWSRLASDSYFGRLERSAALSAATFDSLLALRLAGEDANSIKREQFESKAKAYDIISLLSAYEEFLRTHKFVDAADVFRLATARLQAGGAGALEQDALILIPADLHVTGLERQFVEALPASRRIQIEHPVGRSADDGPATDIGLLACIGDVTKSPPPIQDGSVQFFRAFGEVNEVREVFRRSLAEQIPFDDVEILHTDPETYIPLIYATARRYFSEPHLPNGIPVTFAEGIPAALSRPGRALAAWLQWIAEDYPQRLLVEMIGDGLLNVGDDDLSFSYLVRLLRPIAIGMSGENYLPKLDEQIKVSRKSLDAPDGDESEESAKSAALERRRKGLTSLRRLCKRMLELAHDIESGAPATTLRATQLFLSKTARSVSELDRFAADVFVERLKERVLWLDQLKVSYDVRRWLADLPSETRVLGSGPRPGCLHVAHVISGGHSGREKTFVIGLDDRRFPGAAVQDPILLDRERANMSPELSTSAGRLRRKIDEVTSTLSRLSGKVTLSWSSVDLVDDRETFPSSAVLSAYRLVSGRHDDDLGTLNAAVGPPVSFAPSSSEKALDETDRWLWQLSRDEFRGTDQRALVEASFPRLAIGREAERQRSAGFGPFNGAVAQAGKDLNPFLEGGLVLSASTLETAGRCPRAFFFRKGLNLYLPDELVVDPDRWLDAASFGLLLHEVFRQFMDELSASGERPNFERDHKRLAEILKKTVQLWRNEIPPSNETAYRMQYWQLVRTANIFLQAEEDFCRTSQPRFFEVALGLERVGDGTAIDGTQPVKVGLPDGGSIRAKGQIDRVDQLAQHEYAVWDYKISSGYGYDRSDPFRQGRRVQNILYLRMIENALRDKIDPEATADRFGYFFPSIRAHGLRVDWDAATLVPGLKIVQSLCALVADGSFPATDDVDDCRYCDFAAICGDLERVTTYSKDLLDRDDLGGLNHFRELRRG